MADIIRIIIKGASGYAPADEAYEDRLVLTPSSIAYEYKPDPMSSSETNIYRKWNYKTTSPIFKMLYDKVAEQTPYYLHNDAILFAKDIGPTEIIATFSDKHRESVHYFCPSEFFADYFRVIKQMVPACEYTPAVLLTGEDFADDCEAEINN